MASCNTFTEVVCANGNINLIFFEGSRKRTIIFKKNTEALKEYNFFAGMLKSNDFNSVDDYYRAIVKRMQLCYRFTINDNNVSIFYPILKVPKRNPVYL